MPTYVAIRDQVGPATSGAYRLCYSPDLFDTATGDYPKASPPSQVNYPVINGGLEYFSHAQQVLSKFWPTAHTGGTDGGDAYSAGDQALSDITTDTTYGSVSATGPQALTYITWSWAGNASQTMSGALTIQLEGSSYSEHVTAGPTNEYFASAGSEIILEYSTNGGSTWQEYLGTVRGHNHTGNPENGTFTDTIAKQVVTLNLSGIDISQLRFRVGVSAEETIDNDAVAVGNAHVYVYTALFNQTA